MNIIELAREVAIKKKIAPADVRNLFGYNPLTGNLWWLSSRRGIKAGQIAGRVNTSGYREVMIDGAIYKAHHLAWAHHYGEWPKQLDHKNTFSADNRIANLRKATTSQNIANSRRGNDNSTGLKGVYFQFKKWRAVIHKHGTRYYLGGFTSREAAHNAYVDKAKEIFGEFSRGG